VSERSALRVAVLGSAGGALLAAAVLWALGRLGSAVGLLKRALAGAWDFLGSSVKVSTWLLVIGVLVLFGSLRAIRRLRRSVGAAAGTDLIPPVPSISTAFSDVELAVIRTLVEADGESIPFADLGRRLHTSQIIATQGLDRLFDRGLVGRQDHPLHGWYVFLTRAGREAAIRLEMVS
jgi:DNA-binding MarR family transcriptional regulator